MPGHIFHELHDLWRRPERRDEYFGTLINAWIAEGGHAVGVQAGQQYVDTGTLNGYRLAIHLLENAGTLHSQFPAPIPHKEATSINDFITADSH
jgi:hypothetical protein